MTLPHYLGICYNRTPLQSDHADLRHLLVDHLASLCARGEDDGDISSRVCSHVRSGTDSGSPPICAKQINTQLGGLAGISVTPGVVGVTLSQRHRAKLSLLNLFKPPAWLFSLPVGGQGSHRQVSALWQTEGCRCGSLVRVADGKHWTQCHYFVLTNIF